MDVNQVEPCDLNQPEIPSLQLKREQPKKKKRDSTTKGANLVRVQLFNKIPQLIRNNPIPFFIANLERVFDDWIFLLVSTSLPSDMPSSDPFVLAAFQLLDSAIDGGERIRGRLAHFQLLRVFESLKDIITEERRNGLIPGKNGVRHTVAALTIYETAQSGTVNRPDLSRRKQTAKFWSTLAGPSPFFLLFYSEVTETVAWVHIFFFCAVMG
jgi:hypothetical protein